MSISNFPYLSLLLFFPLIGAILLAFIPKKDTLIIKLFTLVWIVIEFLISIPLYFYFNSDTYNMQFVENYSWMKSLNIHYFLGIDGISLFLVLLTTFLMIPAQWSTWEAIDKKVKEFNIALLLLETGMLGVFLALDGFLFYVFWEFELIPMYLLIGIWGGKFRVYATMKFFLYTFAGSVLMLAALMALYFIHGHFTGIYTFNLVELAKAPLPFKWQFWLFLAFFLAEDGNIRIFEVQSSDVSRYDKNVCADNCGCGINRGLLRSLGGNGSTGYEKTCRIFFGKSSRI